MAALAFVAYADKSTAKRGFGRTFEALKGDIDKYLAQNDGKWGYWKDASGQPKEAQYAAIPEKKVDVAMKKERQEKHARDMAEAAKVTKTKKAPRKPKAEAPKAPEPTPEPLPEVAPPAPQEEPQEPEAASPSPAAFGAFLTSQLTAAARPAEAAQPRATSTAKIERNRPESNGVKRPSAGTLCAQVWDIAAELTTEQKQATLSEVVKAAEAKGINKFTARTQYARWRVFHKA